MTPTHITKGESDMGLFTKIPQDTFDNLQLEAGILLKTFDPSQPAAPSDADIITATTGGIGVSCVPTFSDFGEDIDNCPANMMELKRIDSWEASMTFTGLAATPDSIKLALGAADTTGNKVVPRRNLDATKDFQTLWWVGDRADGGFAAVKIMNSLSTGGFSMQTTKSGKGQFSYTITGHVSIEAQDVVPMEFYVSESAGA